VVVIIIQEKIAGTATLLWGLWSQ